MKTESEYREVQEQITKFLDDIRKIESSKTHFILEITKTHRGWSRERGDTFYISIPTWALRHGLEYVKAYGIHEFTHAMVGLENSHNKIFKRNEKRLLIKYLDAKEFTYHKRTYIRAIRSQAGEELFNLDK